jgi:serine/threonine protein phosphatase PrpC/CRP-like cAMP-binding protein
MARWEALQLFAATDVGRRRPHNEDNFLVDRDLGLCIVADGMGGHAAGEVASALAVETIHDELGRNRDVLLERAEQGGTSSVTVKQLLGLIEGAIQNASARIHTFAQGDAHKRGMGTTLSLLLVLDSLAYVAHVGDSRVYLARDGTLRQLTEDHTMAAEMLRMGMVTADCLDKVPHRNAITRAVGIYPHVNVDTFTLEVLPGDQFVLATDGLTGYLKAEADLLAPLGSEDGTEAVHALVDFANGRGGKDNITVVLLRIGGSEADDGTRARRLALKHEVLARVPLFCRLDERELGSIMGIADVGEYGPGEVVMREGEMGDELYVILSGRLSLAKGQTSIGELGPGEHLGEMALIRTTPRSATVTALEPSALVTLRRRDFFEIIRTEPSVAVKLLWQFVLVLADRLEQTTLALSVAREALVAEDVSDEALSDKPRSGALNAEADPFSGPPPASLGRFRLGYATLQQDGLHEEEGGKRTDEARRLAETLREPGAGRAVVPEDRPSRPEQPRAERADAGRGPSGTEPPAPGSALDGQPAGAQTRGPLPAVPRRGPLPEDLRSTQPFARRAGGAEGEGPNAAAGGGSGEIASLRAEIDELRKQFKERLRKSRDGGRKDESG